MPVMLGMCKRDEIFQQLNLTRAPFQMEGVHLSRQGKKMRGKRHEAELGCWQADAAEDVDGIHLSAGLMDVQQMTWREACESCTTMLGDQMA